MISTMTVSNYFKDYSTTSNSENHNTTSEPEPTLNPLEYESWTRVQVCSLLCIDEKDGGAGMAVEEVKPLYDANIDGSSLSNIVRNIQYKEKRKEATIRYSLLSSNSKDYSQAIIDLDKYPTNQAIARFPSVSVDIIKTFVNWVEDLFNKRLYHLWPVETIKEQLGKPVNEGAGLTKFEIDNVTIEKGNIVSPIIECNKKMSNYLERFTIIVPQEIPTLSTFSIIHLSQQLENEINKFSEKDLTLNIMNDRIEELYESARLMVTGWKNMELPPNLTQKLLDRAHVPELKLEFGQPNFDPKYFSENLPIFGRRLAKFALSNFSKFQKKYEGDEKLKEITALSKDLRHSCFLLGSSGVGKTR